MHTQLSATTAFNTNNGHLLYALIIATLFLCNHINCPTCMFPYCTARTGQLNYAGICWQYCLCQILHRLVQYPAISESLPFNYWWLRQAVTQLPTSLIHWLSDLWPSLSLRSRWAVLTLITLQIKESVPQHRERKPTLYPAEILRFKCLSCFSAPKRPLIII